METIPSEEKTDVENADNPVSDENENLPDRINSERIVGAAKSASPSPDTKQDRYDAIREKTEALGKLIAETTPRSREQSLAITNLEQSLFWADASISRNE